MGALLSLVMSDIVESTRRWAADEASMAADLELHDRVLRAALEGVGGTVCKHTGDGLLAMFDDPAAAVDAAAAIQRAVAAASWRHAQGLRVRVAVHAGLVHRRDNDLFGTAVNRVARLLALCPAGAVLVSGVVAGMLAERALEALDLRRVGAVTLTGFATPEEVHALAGPGLTPVDSVAAAAGGARGGRLPAVDEALVGRDEDLAAIWEALTQGRLATLVGVGGMGKTRLAAEVAAGAAESFADGAWWIDLSAATAEDAALSVAMSAVEAREIPGRTRLQAFTDRFAEASGLVVFDNCEHVLPAARGLVEALRAAAPEMRILATSREALGLRGERILPVGALPAGDAQRLFAERARAVRPDLDIEANRETIARLCARLDFIPLAVELAVARCRSMTPSDIEKRLTDRFRLLRGGRAGAERHRTLQAAVGWSHSLLDAEERHVFERMAIFAGGALLDAIAMVAERDEMDTLDILDRLIARSMITATGTKLGMRYGQLETLRQFAEDRLVETGAIDEIRERHLSWIVALAASLSQAKGLEAEADAFARLGAELDNLRVAIALARDSARDETVYAIDAGLGHMAYLRGDFDLVDQTRPKLLGQTPTEAAIAGAVRGDLVDVARGSGKSGPWFRTRADLPTWFGQASFESRHQFIVTQLISGGDLRFLGDLIDADRPDSPARQLRVDITRLLLAWARQGSEKLSMAEIGEIEEIGRRAVGLARELGTAARLGMALLAFSYAVSQERPTVARPLAQESAEVFGRLGAVYMRGMARRIVIATQFATGVSSEALRAARDDLSLFLSKTQLMLAAALASSAFPAIARDAPAACLRLWAVRRRVVGTDRRHDLERAGLSLPDDVDALLRQTADLGLGDAIKDVLAALDRAIASMEAGAAAEGA